MSIGSIKPHVSGLSQAEKDAKFKQQEAIKQVREVEKQIAETQMEADQRLTKIREDSIHRSSEEAAKQEDEYQEQRAKGVKRLRELKRRQDSEFQKVRRDGERYLSELRDYYRNQTYETDQQGKKAMASLTARNAIAQQGIRNAGVRLEEALKQEQAQKTEGMKGSHKAKLEELRHQHDRKQVETKTQFDDAQKKSSQTFANRYQSALKHHNEILNRILENSNQKLKQIKSDTSSKLSAYGSRQSDPFYQMLDLGAVLEETDRDYVLKAKIPLHEQKYLSVTAKDGQIIVSGKRMNTDQITKPDGGTQTTSAFQSYTETFEINHPVDQRGLERRFDGESLIVRVPKKAFNEKKVFQASRPNDLKVEKPRFPDNLPVNRADT